MGERELHAIYDAIGDPKCNIKLKKLGLKIRRLKSKVNGNKIVDAYKSILKSINKHKKLNKI